MSAKMIVQQCFNPKFNSRNPVSSDNSEHVYLVIQTVDTLAEKIDAYISSSRVQDLIDNYVSVTIKGSKK